MKTNQRGSKSNKDDSIFAKINDFISLNSFVLLLLILGIWLHQVFIVGSTVNELQQNQNRMIHYLKKNVNKVYFLSASGMAITATKSKVSYADERFKSYLVNEITDSLIGGNIVLSSNYKITYASANELITKNKRINHFFKRLVKPHGSVMAPYARSLHRAIVEGKYPEYINVISHRYDKFVIRKPSKETNFKTKIEATIVLRLLVKSWVRDLKEWDTREVPLRINFDVIVDVDKYANIGNPFGVHFKSLDIPIIHKPTGTEIMDAKR